LVSDSKQIEQSVSSFACAWSCADNSNRLSTDINQNIFFTLNSANSILFMDC
jgi:hypothetical protein